MEKLYLEGRKVLLLENQKEIQLDYYLVEEYKKSNNKALYGIRIMEHLDGNLLTEYTQPISESKDKVKFIVHKLWDNEVTLVTMLEVADDLITEVLCD